MTHQKFEQNPRNNFLDLNLRVSSWGTKNRLTRFWDLALNLKGISSLCLQVLLSTTTLYLVCVGCANSRVFCFCPRALGYFKDLLTRTQLCGSDWITFSWVSHMMTCLRYPVGQYLFSLSLSLRFCSTLSFYSLSPPLKQLQLCLSSAVEDIWSTALDVDSFQMLNSPRIHSMAVWATLPKLTRWWREVSFFIHATSSLLKLALISISSSGYWR